MPQEIVSQFDRKYNLPIETNRTVATVTARNNIPPAVRWAGMLCYVISESLTYELRGGIDNTNWIALGANAGGPGIGLLEASDVNTVVINGVASAAVAKTFTIPANTLVENGDTVRLWFYCDLHVSNTSGQIQLKVGANTIGTLVQYTGLDRAAWIEVYLTKKTATQFNLKAARFTEVAGSTSFTVGYPMAGTYDFTSAIDVQILATVPNAGDSIDFLDFMVEYKKL